MKVFTGKVLNSKAQKTLSVEVTRVVIHRLYGKRFKRSKKYLVHDEVGFKEGETVKFVAGRPQSKLKKWITIPNTKVEKGKEKKK